MTNLKIPISVLNIVPLKQGQTPKDALDSMVELAQLTEQLGFKRYWLSEHHNIPNVMSTATTNLMQHVLANTKNILVGAGGIMLPNHSPLVIAEQIGTLEQLYPGRVALGLGRAPGTDSRTVMALRRNRENSVNTFPDEVRELMSYFKHDGRQHVEAIPATGTEVPMYILGSSSSSALLAAELGLPYAFASHFTAVHLKDAVHLYRKHFKPSQYLSKPYVITGINIIAADSMDEAKKLFTSFFQSTIGILQNQYKPLIPPFENLDVIYSKEVQRQVLTAMGITLVGDQNYLKEELQRFTADFQPDELMMVSYIYDSEKQIRSFEIVKDILDNY